MSLKKKGMLEFETLIYIILGILGVIAAIIVIMILAGKGGQALDSLRRVFGG